ncbi:DUF58 domain-containing protein [Paenibacillus sp. 1P07SE]|uniref:DUF58 domain-containing protein n=1 Tax=Paenibacillus sp. 1P07SE TaxID=3132209 RepID=UPI0039A47C55
MSVLQQSTQSQHSWDASQQPDIRRSRWQGLCRILVLILIWSGLALAVRERGTAAEWLALSTLTALIAGALLLPLTALRGVTVSRHVECEVIHCGEEVSVRLTFRSPPQLPLVWVTVREELVSENRQTGAAVAYRRLVFPGLRREWSIGYTLTGLPRGAYRFRPPVLTAGDLFGLRERQLTVAAESCLWVAPAPLTGAFPKEGGYGMGAGMAAEHQKHGRRPGSGWERRAYAAGDPLRHLDWRSAAKGRGWLTRLSADQAAAPLLILLDTYGESTPAGERLLDACAGLALGAYMSQRQGGAELCITGSGGWLRGGETDVFRVQLALAAVRPAAHPAVRLSLKSLLPGGYERGASLLIITSDRVGAEEWTNEAAMIGIPLEVWLVTDGKQAVTMGGGGSRRDMANVCTRSWSLANGRGPLLQLEEGGVADAGIT